MYFLARSYYVNMSWGQKTIYSGLSGFINEETKAKIVCISEAHNAEMLQMFHPCQLERRFGGTADTPKNFWPPYVGKEFIPPGQNPPLIQMSDNEYRKALAENPELYWHPEFINSPDCPSRDFKYMENY